jgi:XTP/dITP diphosphohydrolase
MRILLATQNPGKLREFQAMFGRAHEIVSLADLVIEQAAETGATFIENALQKARHAAEASNLPSLGDDSGLVVTALNGAPGIHSSRYAGEHADDSANNAKLLRELTQGDRSAHFYCALVLLRHATDPAPLIATGQWRGSIALTPSGSNGFGYDPLFIDAASGLSAAKLAPTEKHARSHRGNAWRSLSRQLDLL